MTADLLARVRAEIDARLTHLRPALAEYERLEGAYDALKAAPARKAAKPALVAKPARKAAKPALVAKPARKAAKSAPVAKPARATRRGPRGSAAGALKRAASAPLSIAQQAIVAALEHGSHTVGELVLVTAMSGSEIREGARQLKRAGTIAATKRDGRAAYALSSAATD